MEGIRDLLTVGQDWRDRQVIVYRGDKGDQIVASFPREDEAWGVVSLILEYVESYGYSPGYAIDRALAEYREARAESLHIDRVFGPLDNELDATDAAYQDHAHAMGYVS